MFYVYEMVDPRDNSTFYVGKGQADRALRYSKMSDEQLAVSKIQQELCRHVLSIRLAGCQPNILFPYINLTEDEAFEYERSRIALYRRTSEGGTLLNKTTGGNGLSGHTFSAAHRAAIGLAHRGKAYDAQTRALIAQARTGSKASDSTRKKMSEARKGKNLGETNPMFGFVPSDEQRRNRSRLSQGENNGMYGRKHSEETKAKMSEKRKLRSKTNAA